MAKAFIQDCAYAFYSDDKYREDLAYHVEYDTFMMYENGHYKLFEDRNEFRRKVTGFTRQKFPNQNWPMSTIDDVIKWIKVECPKRVTQEDDHLIAFKDKLYNLNTGEPEPFSKDKYTLHYVPYNLDEVNMEIPIFNKFLETSMTDRDAKETDYSLVELVKEMLGSLFIPNMKAGKAFFLYGQKGDNGKGILSQIVRIMMGDGLCSALSLEDLSKDFTKHKLIGKKVNVSDELDEKFGKSRIFKAIVTGDPIFTRRLYGDGFDFIPKTTLVFTTNRMPTFDGLDGGLVRRMEIIPFYKSFTNDPNKDYDLIDKLQAEIPGIIGLSLRYARKLMKNRYQFTRSESIDKALDEFKGEISSAIMFFNDYFVVDDTGRFSISVMYEKYQTWCYEYGKKPMGRINFTRDISNNIDGIKKSVKRIDNIPTNVMNVMLAPNEMMVPDDDVIDVGGEEVEF